MWFLVKAAMLAAAASEIGLSVWSPTDELSGKPVRIVDSELVVGGEIGPIFQATFANGSMVLSRHVVSRSAFGAGVGVDKDNGRLIIAYEPIQGFNDHEGWLEFNGTSEFRVKNGTNGWQLFANLPTMQNDQSVQLELAALVYPDENKGNTQLHEESTSSHTNKRLGTLQQSTTERQMTSMTYGRALTTSLEDSDIEKALTSRPVATPISSKDGHWAQKDDFEPSTSRLPDASTTGTRVSGKESKNQAGSYVYTAGTVIESPGSFQATFKFSGTAQRNRRKYKF